MGTYQRGDWCVHLKINLRRNLSPLTANLPPLPPNPNHTGEDPFLMGEYAAAFVAAMQWGEGYNGAPDDTRGVPLKTANTCKHFAGVSF